MPKYLPVSTIRTMPYAELERWWETDFEVLASTAVAEAIGPVHPTVAEALRTEDWIEQWADALYAATGGLATSVERMTFTHSPSLEQTRKNFASVSLRMEYVNNLIAAQRRERNRWTNGSYEEDSEVVCLGLMAKHFHKESSQLGQAEVARRGLAPHNPWHNASYADRYDAIEHATREGLIDAPLTPQVQHLLAATDQAVRAVVGKDATQQEDRRIELRHPLLLRRWLESLSSLRDEHCQIAGLVPEFNVTLPAIDMDELFSMRQEDAWKVINRRRFIRSLAQRHRECDMHSREVTQTVVTRQNESRAPWSAAYVHSRIELGKRHPQEMRALMVAFKPFCVPGTTTIRKDFLGKSGPVSSQLIPTLKKALRDGTWARLLD